MSGANQKHSACSARSAEWGFFLDVAGLRGRGALFGVWVDLERAAIRLGSPAEAPAF